MAESLSKQVKNTVGRGETAISPFPTVYSVLYLLKDLYCRDIETTAYLGND